MITLIRQARDKFHTSLILSGVLSIDRNGVPSNADKDSRLSKAIAANIVQDLNVLSISEKNKGQVLGGRFEVAVMQFLKDTFPYLSAIRPGNWNIERLGNRNPVKTSSFIQYEHLEYLNEIRVADRKLASALGNDYMVSPDIVISRLPESDEIINSQINIVDDSISTLSSLRLKYNKLPILHASISAKWTMRSDRAQNSRTEALGLIRNRKGHLPHIAVVTAEPLPSRLASLALGTGDIDCLYHFALYELVRAIETTGTEDAKEMLSILIEGKRLKDISDLPIDLAV